MPQNDKTVRAPGPNNPRRMTTTTSDAFSAHRLPLQRLYHFEREEPDRVAFTQPMGAAHGNEVRDITWRQVVAEARCMAAYLRQQGFPAGSRIAILSRNCAHWLVADFAIWLAGHVSVPLYPTLAAGTIGQILAHCEARLLFVGKLDGWDGMKPGVPPGLPLVSLPLSAAQDLPRWDEIVAGTPPLEGNPVRDADETCTIIYTSGTSGESKGVVHTFGTLSCAAHLGLRRIPLRRDGRLLSYLPLAHIAERALVELGLLASGCRVFFADSIDTFPDDLRRARPTVFFSVPRLWFRFRANILARMPQRKLDLLLRVPLVASLVRRKILRTLGLDRCVFAIGGAAPMPAELVLWFARIGLPVAEGYGMTENGGLSHATTPGRLRPGTVGWSVDGVACRIQGVDGEIQFSSGGLMKGYYRDPALTAQAFTADGWLRSGDTGRIEADGALRITGRVKDIFKTSKGKYVAPAPIEGRLVMHEDVDAGIVLGAGLPQPLAVVVLSEAGLARARHDAGRTQVAASLATHVAQVNEWLDPHERLSCIVVASQPWTVETGFLTPTLKVRRARLEEFFGARLDAWRSAGTPVVWSAA